MTPWSSRRLSAAPQTWQARMEIAKAIRMLAAQEEDELLQRRAEIAAIRRDYKLIAQALREVCRELVQGRFQSQSSHGCRPVSPGGGQWTSGGESGS